MRIFILSNVYDLKFIVNRINRHFRSQAQMEAQIEEISASVATELGLNFTVRDGDLYFADRIVEIERIGSRH